MSHWHSFLVDSVVNQLPPISRPDHFAQTSARVVRANEIICSALSNIGDAVMRQTVEAILQSLHATSHEVRLASNVTVQRMDSELVRRFSSSLPYDPWWGGAAAAPTSHHCYPGGWLLHTATNLQALDGLIATSEGLRGATIDRDALTAAVLLHDWGKPKMSVWVEGELDVYEGTFGHHVAAIAEAYLHELPRSVVVLLAGAHAGWWIGAESVKGYLQRAAELIGDDTLAEWGEVAERDMTLSINGWIMRQAEVAWHRGSQMAMCQTKKVLEQFLQVHFPAAERTALLWYLLAQMDEFEWCSLSGNESALKQTIQSLLQRTP